MPETPSPPPESLPIEPLPEASARRWTAADRKALILWLAIGLVLPGVFALVLVNVFGLGIRNATLTIGGELSVKAISAFCVLLATWLAARMQQRPLGDYGIPPREALGWRFWEGAAWGFAMLSLLLLPLWMTGHFRVESAALRGSSLFAYAFGWALVFLCVSVEEELTFRGYPLFIAARRARFWRAAIGLSVGFGVAHLLNPGETLVGILQVVGTGFLFCFTIRRTGNLWFALGFHASWDWAQTFFYGTPDSGLKSVGYFLNTSMDGPAWLTGGSTGPEGSIFSLVILAIAALLVHLRFPNAVYPDRPA